MLGENKCQKKICPQCGKLFTPKTGRQIFHRRKCYMLSYRSKEKEQKYPLWICPKCKEKIQLTFHPKMNHEKFKNLKCPKCRSKREPNGLDK